MSCDKGRFFNVITCPGFNEYYFSESSHNLRVRVHKQHINTSEYRQIYLSAHLETCGKISISQTQMGKCYQHKKNVKDVKMETFIQYFVI